MMASDPLDSTIDYGPKFLALWQQRNLKKLLSRDAVPDYTSVGDRWYIPEHVGQLVVVFDITEAYTLNGSGWYISPSFPEGEQGLCWGYTGGDYLSIGGVTSDDAYYQDNCVSGSLELYVVRDPNAAYDIRFGPNDRYPPGSALRLHSLTRELWTIPASVGDGGGPGGGPPDCPEPAWPYTENLGGVQDTVGVMRFTQRPNR